MKNKIFTLLLALTASIGMANAEIFKVGDLYYKLNANNTAEVSSVPNGQYAGDITIPDSIVYDEISYSVTSIGDYAFWYCRDLTSVIISNSVTNIGDHAFYFCTNLKHIVIGDSVKRIGEYAFYRCYDLQEALVIPNSVTMIERNAFYLVPNIIYSGIETETSWGERCRNGYEDGYLVYSDETKTNLQACFTYAKGTINISDSVTSIGSNAFCGCIGITHVTIGKNITYIGESVFDYCDSLTSITWNVMSCSDYSSYSTPFLQRVGNDFFYTKSHQILTLTFGEEVEYVPAYLCTYFNNLTTLVSESTTPPLCGDNVFFDVDCSQIPLYVPDESVELYKDADQWKEFNPILGLSSLENKKGGTLNGVFTINAGGNKVYFSQGNLQHNSRTMRWRFANQQFDYIGTENMNIGGLYDGWIDLFGWGTSGWDSGANAYWPFATNSDNTDYSPGGLAENALTGAYANADWGVYNAISNGGNQPGMWRTLTNKEWNYLFYSRANADNLHGQATINNTHGYILLPDDFILPSGLRFTPQSNNWDTNVYNLTEWQQLEESGVVFLPCAGTRGNNYFSGDVEILGDNFWGRYWSSTPYQDLYAYFVFFSSSYQYIEHYTRSSGLSVRLVRDIMVESSENVCSEVKTSSKILRDGQILILRGDKTYTLTGQEVR